ncbi:MAG: AraC family transcriptional regulator [Moraxellaceae bacterium]|nr:MAG: AraC family transcriptional regulator [Moraxellaceae bacterium]
MDNYVALVKPGIWQLSLVASTFLWLKGPFIWIFLNVLERRDVTLSRLWPHFVPWACALIALWVHPQAAQIIMFMGMAHMLGYLCRAIWRFTRARAHILELWSGLQNSSYYWLLYILIGLMALVAIDFVVMSLVSLGVIAGYSLLDYWVFPTFSVFALSIGVLSVYRPELWFKPEPEFNEDDSASSEVHTACDNTFAHDAKPTNSDPKERYLALDTFLAHTLLQQLTTLMRDQQMYRQSELSLPALAAALDISVHQVSELLNAHLGKSFYEVINEYRLNHACRLLSDASCQLRVLDVAFDAGFNNKNSFYRTFKDSFGVTPTQFRANALNPQAA